MITSIIMKTVNLLITILREGEDQALIRMSRWWWRILVGGVLVSGVVYPAQAAVTTYPITGIQVVQTRVYQTNSQNGVGYHLTVVRHQRAQLRVNLHLKYHQHTQWARTEQADIYRNGHYQRFYYVHNGHQQSGWIAANQLKPASTASVQLRVPLIDQLPELPTGCEMTATTMMLQYAGVNINKEQFASHVPRSSNPNTGFVGDPASAYGIGLYIYPQGLLPTIRHYLPSAVDLSGVGLQRLKAQLTKRHPVVAWVQGLDGFASHTVTLTGYTTATIRYNDPWRGQSGQMDNQAFETMWQLNGRRALSY